MALIRLNYAVEPRYGVLVDIASRVMNGEPVDLTMGYFNAIWQGDANKMVLASLDHTTAPPNIINITGEETLSVRHVAEEFGKHLKVTPRFTGKESDTALLNNASKILRTLWKAQNINGKGNSVDSPMAGGKQGSFR